MATTTAKPKTKKKQKSKKKSTSQSSSGFLWLPYALLSFLLIAIYHPSVNHGFAVDDKIVIEENTNVQRGIVAIPSIFGNTTFYGFDFEMRDKTYRPMPLSMYAMEISLFGLNPGVHHFFNLFYFLLLGFGIFYLCNRYFFPRHHWALSAGIAAVFIAHPVHVEAVANIKGRDDLVCLLFFIGALIALFKYWNNKNQKWLWLSGVSYLCALFSKEIAVTFLPIFPMAIYFFSQKTTKAKNWQEEIQEIIFPLTRWIPYVGAVLVFFAFRAVAIQGQGFEITAANNALLGFETPVQQLTMTFYVLFLYIKLHLWPNPLLWDYSEGHFQFDQMKMVWGVVSVLLYSGMFFYAVKAFKRKSVYAFGFLFYLITISLVSNVFIKIASTMGERLIFIPSFGLLLAGCYGLYSILRKYQPHGTPSFYSYAIIAILIPFSYLANDRVKDWKDGATLVMHDAQYGNSYRLRKAYIQELADRAPGDKKANQQLALAKVAELVQEKSDDNETWYYYGNLLKSQGQLKEAIVAFQNSINLEENNFASHNLGICYFNLGRNQEAIPHFQKALELEPSQDESSALLAHLYHLSGNYDQAKYYYEYTLQLKPDNVKVKENYQKLLNGN